MITGVEKLVGVGLYTPAEAALYARVHNSLMNRWLFGDARGNSVIKPQIGVIDDEKIITFLDFVQTLAIRAIRQTRKVPLQKIREAIDQAKRLYRIDYPFAIKHTTYLLDANGLACRYRAWKKDGYEVIMDPHQRFGEPLLPSCGYTARTLFDAYRIEGGIEQAAKCYGVELAEVKTAIEYFDHLQTSVA
jgi:uncharacterized protein (DUF433 family)